VIPTRAIGNPTTIVVFMADGESVPFFAKTAFDSFQSSTFPPMAFFGLCCSEGGQKRKERAEEYLGPKGQDLFDHHHDVFINVMPKLATRMLKFNLCRSTTVAAGFSNGGAFVYRMAFEHPGLFGNVVLMSPQRIRKEVDLSKLTGYETKFFLAAGELGLERLFKKNALRIKQDLDEKGLANTFFHDPNGDHNFILWDKAFPKAISWFFDGSSVDIKNR
jgi:enterochelin esterase-like enzyme